MCRKRKNHIKIKTVCLASVLAAGQCGVSVVPVMASQRTEKETSVSSEDVERTWYEGTWKGGAYTLPEDPTGVVPDCVADIFDAEFYRKKYPDVKAAFGDDEKALLHHFLTFGLTEGRQGSRLLDIAKYRSMYRDLEELFGDNWDLYVRHYFLYGIAEGRKSGIEDPIAVRRKNGIYYDSNGNILIPWEDIAGEEISGDDPSDPGKEPSEENPSDPGKEPSKENPSDPGKEPSEENPSDPENEPVKETSLTLETLREKCGSSLILLTDQEGNVTFVGGNFSGVKVTDKDSAEESLQCIRDLIDFPSDTAVLYLTHVSQSSVGDTYYRFSAQEKESGKIYSETDIVVGTDPEGNVLCMSSSSGNRYYQELPELECDWDEIHEEMKKTGAVLISSEPVLKYDSDLNQYAWIKYYERDGIIIEVSSLITDGRISGCQYTCRFYREMPGEDSYSFDYFFENDIKTEDWIFTDYFGNTVTLPVAHDGNGYYILDKERKMVGVESFSVQSNVFDQNVKLYYFQTPEELSAHYVSAVCSAQSVYDTYRKLGLYEKPKTFLLGFASDKSCGASMDTHYGASCLIINDHFSNACFDVIAHEMAHEVQEELTGFLRYQNALGAIQESYADILGNLLEMIAVKDGNSLGEVDQEEWLIGEAVKMSNTDWVEYRNMADPEKLRSPSKVGGAYYIIDQEKGWDNGGVHYNSGILNQICCRMYREAGISMEDLFVLWYDTLILPNHDSDYQSMQKYMEYSLRRHGMEDKIDQVNGFFEDARVTYYETTWENLETAEGASKAVFRFRNVPEGVTFIACIYAPEYALTYCDDAGEYGVILKDGTYLNSICLYSIDDPGIDYPYAVGAKLGYVMDGDDLVFTGDYLDFLASTITYANTEIPEQYQEELFAVCFAMDYAEEGIIQGWEVHLSRTLETGVDFVARVNVFEENEMGDGTRRVVLRTNSEYSYTVSVTMEDGSVWEKNVPGILNTTGMEKEEKPVVTIAFQNDGTEWVKQEYPMMTVLAELSEEPVTEMEPENLSEEEPDKGEILQEEESETEKTEESPISKEVQDVLETVSEPEFEKTAKEQNVGEMSESGTGTNRELVQEDTETVSDGETAETEISEILTEEEKDVSEVGEKLTTETESEGGTEDGQGAESETMTPTEPEILEQE